MWKKHRIPDSFLVRTQVKPGAVVMDFKAYYCSDWEDIDGKTGIDFEIAGSVSSGDRTEDVEQARVFLEGGLKWDGCCNFQFPEQNECMLHTCGRHNMIEIGELLLFIYDLGKTELGDHWYPEPGM